MLNNKDKIKNILKEKRKKEINNKLIKLLLINYYSNKYKKSKICDFTNCKNKLKIEEYNNGLCYKHIKYSDPKYCAYRNVLLNKRICSSESLAGTSKCEYHHQFCDKHNINYAHCRECRKLQEYRIIDKKIQNVNFYMNKN